MKVSDFDYSLPDELIAQFPCEQRSQSRLLKVAADGSLSDAMITDIVDSMHAGDLLVLNNTRVIPARLYGRKDTGGKVEILLERVNDSQSILAQVRASKSPKTGQKLFVDDGFEVDESRWLEVMGRQGDFFCLCFSGQESVLQWLDKVGHIPLPPYIERDDVASDSERYQTVYSSEQGAVAAPTAGLHYDKALLDKIRAKGVRIEMITLHVGAGTYQPVRVDSVSEHVMHAEYVDVSAEVCQAIQETRQANKNVIAVGTTVVRALESAARAARDALIEPFSGDTDIFIYPGYEFKVVDRLQTNFHLPKSTLLMLVSAFAGTQTIRSAYQHAIEKRYRFFSYGDAMLLEKKVY